MVLNSHLCCKVEQGHSVSTAFINLGSITLNISMSPLTCKFQEDPIKTDGAMQQTKLIIGIFSNQRT